MENENIELIFLNLNVKCGLKFVLKNANSWKIQKQDIKRKNFLFFESISLDEF